MANDVNRKNPFEKPVFPRMGSVLEDNKNDGIPGIVSPEDLHDDSEADISDEELKRLINDFIVRKEDWATTHPANLACRSDEYYADLANMIAISVMMFRLPPSAPEGLVREVALSVTAYLEDLVSGLGVWDSFRSLYRKKYGKWLPFYDCEHAEYMLDNVNIEDVKFLVWQSFCRCGQPQEVVFSPYSQGVNLIADCVYEMIVDRFETAPEASRVADYLHRVFRKGDFYEVRGLGEWLVANNPLISAPNTLDSIYDEAESLASESDAYDEAISLYFVKSIKACSLYTGPMDCRSSVYLAEMCRKQGFDELSSRLEKLEVIKVAVFKVREVGKKDIILEDLGGEEYVVAKDSFGKGQNFKDAKGYMTSLVKYGDKWYQNGVATAFMEDPFEKVTEMPTYHENAKSRAWLKEIVDRNGGERIFYCRNMEEVALIMGVSNRGGADSNQDADNYILMLSDEEGPVVLQNYGDAFKDKRNPYYNKREAKEDALCVIADGNVPDDIAKIIAEKKLLPDAEMTAQPGKRFGKAIVQDNMRFLFDFFRTRNPCLD